MASTGVATNIVFARECEDTITLTVLWENYLVSDAGEVNIQSHGHAVYTASWIMPKADVHTQQRVFYMGHTGEASPALYCCVELIAIA